MENREQYKRLIMFFASALILLVQVVIFYYIWHRSITTDQLSEHYTGAEATGH